jgi:hypothetical protein
VGADVATASAQETAPSVTVEDRLTEWAAFLGASDHAGLVSRYDDRCLSLGSPPEIHRGRSGVADYFADALLAFWRSGYRIQAPSLVTGELLSAGRNGSAHVPTEALRQGGGQRLVAAGDATRTARSPERRSYT